jgi:RNA polymerase-interacting CarD/CdnL/TRCF family regulator
MHDSAPYGCHPENEAWFLREPPGQSEIGCGVDVLSGGESNWSRRYKANLEKLASGDLGQVVQVVRDLAERDASWGLSAAEKRMLARARLILLQEG